MSCFGIEILYLNQWMICYLMFLSLSEKDDEYIFEIVQRYFFTGKVHIMNVFISTYVYFWYIHIYIRGGGGVLRKCLISTCMNIFLCNTTPIHCIFHFFFSIIPADYTYYTYMYFWFFNMCLKWVGSVSSRPESLYLVSYSLDQNGRNSDRISH